MICLNLTKLYIYEFSYKFDTVLHWFPATETSDITFMGRNQEPIPPFIFLLESL